MFLIYTGLAFSNNLSIGGNARLSGAGFSKVAITNDNASLLANPASVGVAPFMFSMARSELFGLGIFYNYFEGSVFKQQWRFGFSFESIKDQDLLDNSGYYQQLLTIGIARRLNNLQVGVNVRGTEYKLLDEPMGTGKAIDLGLKVGPLQLERWEVNTGLKIDNVLSSKQFESGREENPETKYTFGVSMGRDNKLFSIDLGSDGFSCGFEYDVLEALALRAGIVEGQPTIGIGLKQGYLQIDYAFWLANAGVTHRVGTTLVF